ncbi:MAG: YdcF family protein [Verrucomicrobia bacterium]|nr:YdcF family protein [Verrucomicrobiota bacterium]
MNLGLIKRKESWCLTARGWLASTLLLAGVMVAVITSIFPFLALNRPVGGELLVVEGWLPDYSLADLKTEFGRGGYKLLVITGNPILKGEPLVEFKNYAELTRSILLKTGWPDDKVVAVPSAEALRDRTYTAALALRAWIAKSEIPVRSITIFSRGAHARRTWMLFRMALNEVAEVGVLASQDLRYEGRRWWRTSEGVRDIIDESIAYLYARFLFRP